MVERSIRIKNYLSNLFVKEDALLKTFKEQARENQMPIIEIPETVGKLLYCLAKIQNPKRILEVGTLFGYSSIWLARSLGHDGKMVSLELNPDYALIARKNFERAGLSEQIEVCIGEADKIMDQMIENKELPFDLIFIDADKERYPLYLEKVLQLSHEGTLILSDNLIPKGENIGEPESDEAEGIYAFNQQMATHPRLESILATTIVGEKGRIDALGIAIVKN